jgi:hypothetical protein
MKLDWRAAVAVASTAVLAFGGVGLINADEAHAETLTATGGTLKWGIKASLLNYHIVMHSGTTQSVDYGEGVSPSSETRGPANETYPAYWNFPFVSGSYDSTTKKYTAQFGGWVAIKDTNPDASEGPGTASPWKFLKLANPKVEIDVATATKRLILDVQPGASTGPAEPTGPIQEDVEFATFPNVTVASEASGGTVAYNDAVPILTAAGAASFSTGGDDQGFGYNEGTDFDPITTTLTGLGDGGGSPSPSPTTPGGGGGGGGSDGVGNGGSSGGGSSGGGSTGGGSSGGGTGSGGSGGGPSFNAGPPPPPPGGWFGPPMMPGGSNYNPPPWFRPPPPYGMPPPQQYAPQQQYAQPQQYYAQPQSAPAPVATSPPVAVAAPPAELPTTRNVASSPTASPRYLPDPKGPADGASVTVGAQDEMDSGSTGVAMLAVILGIGAAIAFFTTRGVRDVVMRGRSGQG